MNRMALLISAVATITGVVLLRVYIHRFEQETKGGTATRVLVLSKDVAPGTPLRRDMLGSRDLPPVCLESRHVLARDIDQVLDARVAVGARANESLSWTDLQSLREPARQLSQLVPEGMRGMTLGIRFGASERLIAPGDRVDVLLTPHGKLDEATLVTSIVAENVLVLAVGNNLGGTEPSRERSRDGYVTVSVSPELGARLAEAEQRGSLRLTVRNADDIELTGQVKPLSARQAAR
jgi:Flp pilus assembly protein CpaB